MKTGTRRTIEVRYAQGEALTAYAKPLPATRSRNAGEGTTLTSWRPMDRPAFSDGCHGKGLTVGPHNRCTHETAPPAGYKRCGEGYDCPVLLPAHVPERYCREHQWSSDAVMEARERLTQLMEA